MLEVIVVLMLLFLNDFDVVKVVLMALFLKWFWCWMLLLFKWGSWVGTWFSSFSLATRASQTTSTARLTPSWNAESDSGPIFFCRTYFSNVRGSGIVTTGPIFRTNEFPDQPTVRVSASTKSRIESEDNFKTVRENPDISRLVMNLPAKIRSTLTE